MTFSYLVAQLELEFSYITFICKLYLEFSSVQYLLSSCDVPEEI